MRKQIKPRFLFTSSLPLTKQKVKFKFRYLKSQQIKEVQANLGENLLQIAHQNQIDIQGACQASLACSTCHVILNTQIFDSLQPACEEQDDLLDLAYGLTHTSRLGCQVKVDKSFEGTIVDIPTATRNFYVDGHKPKPH